MPEKLNLKRNNLFIAKKESLPGNAIVKIFTPDEQLLFFVFARKVTTKFAVKKKLN
jgi:hypothetical protein